MRGIHEVYGVEGRVEAEEHLSSVVVLFYFSGIACMVIRGHGAFCV